MRQRYYLESKMPFHIYGRGVEKRIIYTDYAEYCRFVFLLWVARIGKPKVASMTKEQTISAAQDILRGKKPDQNLYIKEHEPLVSIIAWNLMPNHYHLLLVSQVDGGISKYMAKIGDAYTKYFNIRHQPRSGHLFQSSYESIEVKLPRYFHILLRYINLNHAELIEPQWKGRRIQSKGRLRTFIDKHEWSSHRDYMGLRHSRLVDRDLAGELYGAKFGKEGLDGYEEFIKYWIDEEFDTGEVKQYLLDGD